MTTCKTWARGESKGYNLYKSKYDERQWILPNEVCKVMNQDQQKIWMKISEAAGVIINSSGISKFQQRGSKGVKYGVLF